MLNGKIVARSENYLETKLDEETLILNHMNGDMISLDDTAQRIWELIAEPRQFEALCELLAAEFEVSGHEFADEVSEFLNDMAGRRLVTVSE